MSDESNELIWIVIILINAIIYGICCYFILKRKFFSAISIRSPTLLICNNISNFIMSLTLILHKLVDSNFISIFYYVFRFMMDISIFLRYERILSCFKYNTDKFNTNENMEKFADKRYLLQEKFYVRIFMGLFCIFFISLIIIELIGISCFELFFTSFNIEDNEPYKSQMSIWLTLNFLETIAIMTYIFRLYNKKLKFILKKELYIILILLFLYSNFISFFNLFFDYNDSLFTFVTLIVLYLFLILNGYLPIVSSFLYKNIIFIYFLQIKIVIKLFMHIYLKKEKIIFLY